MANISGPRPEVPDVTVTRYKPRHPWQDWRWVAGVAALVLAVAVTSIAVSAGRALDLNEQNRNTLVRLDANQRGIDELVAFVHDVEKQQDAQAACATTTTANPGTTSTTTICQSQAAGQSKVVQDLLTLLCSSRDPERLAACEQLGYHGANR